jgi:hypothetical protein
MIRTCKSCGKEFQSFNEGVVYSSTVKGVLDFCSDVCCKDYLDASLTKSKNYESLALGHTGVPFLSATWPISFPLRLQYQSYVNFERGQCYYLPRS